MGRDFAVRVELTFAGRQARDFNDAGLAGKVAKAPAPFDREVTVQRTVAAATDAWSRTGYLRVSVRGERWIATGFFGEDAFRDLASELAVLMRVGAEHGAAGKALVLAVEDLQGYQLDLLKAGLRIKEMSEGRAEMTAQKSWVRELVEAAADKLNAELGLPPRPKPSDSAWYKACVQALALLHDVDASRIWEAAADLPGTVLAPAPGAKTKEDYVRLQEAFPGGEELKAALLKGQEWARQAAVPLLSRVDPGAAEPLATAILRDPQRDFILTSGADWALGVCGTRTALDELFALLEAGERQVAGGLIEHPSPEVPARALAMLTPERIQSYAQNADDDHGRDDPIASGLIQVLRHRAHPERLQKLLEIWSVAPSHLVAIALLETGERAAYEVLAPHVGDRKAWRCAEQAREAQRRLSSTANP